jgi:KaiC/GvpD/RAD55 family RecA-like ATPase
MPTNKPDALLQRGEQTRVQFNSYPSDQRPSRPQKPVLVQGVLRAGEIAMIVGAPGAGKSTSAVHLAETLVRGRLWFGRLTTPTPVFYCCAEGPDAIEATEKAWLGYHGEVAKRELFYCEEPFRLDADLDVDAFVDHILEREAAFKIDFGVIFFDTQSDFLGDVEENSNSEMRKIMSALQRIARILDVCVIVIHHYGKDETRGPRGAQAVNAKLDVRLDCTSEGDLTRLKVGKLRRGKRGAVFTARREEVVVGVDSFGQPETGCVVVEQLGQVPKDAVPATLTLEQAIFDIVAASPKALKWPKVRESLKLLNFARDEAERVAAERARDRLASGPSPKIDYDKKTKLVRLHAIVQAVPVAAARPAPANDDGQEAA